MPCLSKAGSLDRQPTSTWPWSMSGAGSVEPSLPSASPKPSRESLVRFRNRVGPNNGLPRSGESRPRFWARLPPSAACRSLPSAELRAGTIRSRLESRRATFHAAMVLVASPSRTSPWSDLGLAGGTRWGRASCVHPAHGRGLLHPLRCFALSMRLRR
jgi:hypothetical protein